MNKTFLALLLIGVSYTAYNAAAVSENFEISTTIDHEIVLGVIKAASADAKVSVDQDFHAGTIVFDPTHNNKDFYEIEYDENGYTSFVPGITSVSSVIIGQFSADIDNPANCNGTSHICGGLAVTELFDDGIFYCESFKIKSIGNNKFKVFPWYCGFLGIPAVGKYQNSLTITYTPG
ncbi:MAG: hypothetical protein IJ689_04455 [Alphaproteobacteria bacterium]|nr:hypothetical protein [Alphaproteobacteria bacterium]